MLLPIAIPQSDRDGVANQSPYAFAVYRFALGDEFVGFRKALKNRAFPERNRAILLGVPEPAISIAVILRGYRWGGGIPSHSAINAGVGPPGLFSVAVGAKIILPVMPSSRLA